MFRVEVEHDDELMDLVALMARHQGVSYRETRTIETENRRLADAVGALCGREAVSDQLSAVSVEGELIRGLWGLSPIGQAVQAVETQDVASLPIADAAHGNGAGPKRKSGTCRYCGVAVGPRHKVCDADECQKRQKRMWQERWEAKQAGKAGPRQGAEAASEQQSAAGADQPVMEAAGSEGPFPVTGPAKGEVWYQVPSPTGPLAMTFQELMLGMAAGEVSNGTRVRALPSGRFYEARDGSLIRPGEGTQSPEAAVPGQTAAL